MVTERATCPKIRFCLWFDMDAEEAARFYCETFADSTLGAVPLINGFKMSLFRPDDFGYPYSNPFLKL